MKRNSFQLSKSLKYAITYLEDISPQQAERLLTTIICYKMELELPSFVLKFLQWKFDLVRKIKQLVR